MLTNCSDPYDEELKYHRELLWHREEGEQRIGGMNVITAFFFSWITKTSAGKELLQRTGIVPILFGTSIGANE